MEPIKRSDSHNVAQEYALKHDEELRQYVRSVKNRDWAFRFTQCQEYLRENQGADIPETYGYSIPTDTTPSHLGLPERVHVSETDMKKKRLRESKLHGGVRTKPLSHYIKNC
jgi:hypothetical protein